MLKKIFITVITILTLAILSACGDAGGGAGAGAVAPADQGAAQQEQEPAAGQAANDANGGETVQIRFMDVIPNPARTELFHELIDTFNQTNGRIQVTLESSPWDQAHQNLVILGATNNMPDVFYMHTSWFAEFVHAEWVHNIQEFYDNFIYKDQLLPFVTEVLIEYDQVTARGGVFGMPKGLTTHGMYVRVDWVEEAGLTLEDLETWEGIFEAAEAMTNPELGRFGFTFRGGRLGGEQMGMFVMSELGGRLFDENGVSVLNTPEAIDAIRRFTNLYKDGFSPADSVNWGFPETVQAFTSGVTGILNQTTGTVAVAKERMEEGTWTVLPFPRARNGNIYGKADAFLLALGADGQHPAEAFEFVTFLLSPENNFAYGRVNSYIPVIQGADEDPFFSEGVFAGFFRSMTDPNFVRQPFYGYFPEVSEFMEIIYDSEPQRVLLGQQTVEEFADLIANWLTEHQQAFMAENPDVPIPMPIFIN